MATYLDIGARQSGAGLDIGPLQSQSSFLQTVDPAAATSRRAVGTPYIVVPGIGPGFAPTRRHVGTPTIMGGALTVSPAFAPTRRALGSPNIAGPVSMGAAPTRRFVGTPFLNAVQSIAPNAGVSRRFVGTPSLARSQSIAPAAAPTRRFVGTPSIKGGPGFVRPNPGVSRRFVGIPAIAGGNGQLTVYCGGAVWQGTVLAAGGSDSGAPVSYESSNPPTITSQTLGRWTLNVDLFDTTGNFAPTRGQTILVMENGLNLFAGCIQTVGRSRLMGTQKAIIYHVLATDKSGICDRRLIPTITFPAGSDVAQVIFAIVATNLNGEGISTTPQSVPDDGSLGTLSSSLTFNYDTVTSGFNQIATLSGTIWYVNQLGILFFNSFNNLEAAPFSLFDNGTWPPTPTSTSNNFRSLMVEETNIDYANEVYAISNLNTLPGSGTGGGGGGGTASGTNTETYVMTAGNLGVLVLPDGVTVFGISTTQPIGTLYSITVDGFTQTVVNVEQWNGQEPVFGTDDFGPWNWDSNSTQVAASVITGAAFPLPGSTLVINYTPFTTNAQALLGEALSPVDPATGGTLGTCGSGVYQVAIQVQNVSSIADLNAIAAAELVKRNGLPVKITFQTDKPGLMPGQILNVNVPGLYLDNVSFLIIYVQGIAAVSPLEFGSRFQWQVQAQTSTDPGNWYQWYANLLQNASNPLPVFQYEDASFVLAPGSSLVGGLISTNPYLVKRTGQLVVMYAAAGIPPTGQDLNIFFFVNGLRVPGQVTIPAGSAANTPFAFTLPTTNPLFVFNTATENDVVTIGTSYSVKSGNPTPASNVSASLRWRM